MARRTSAEVTRAIRSHCDSDCPCRNGERRAEAKFQACKARAARLNEFVAEVAALKVWTRVPTEMIRRARKLAEQASLPETPKRGACARNMLTEVDSKALSNAVERACAKTIKGLSSAQRAVFDELRAHGTYSCVPEYKPAKKLLELKLARVRFMSSTGRLELELTAKGELHQSIVETAIRS